MHNEFEIITWHYLHFCQTGNLNLITPRSMKIDQLLSYQHIVLKNLIREICQYSLALFVKALSKLFKLLIFPVIIVWKGWQS